jgi:hypothetical protein
LKTTSKEPELTEANHVTWTGDVDDLELSGFPVIPDFAIRLVDTAEGGRHVEYFSVRQGRLAGFPAWDHADRDLRHFIPSDVPIGTSENPYEDRDEGWRIVIFENGGYVHILEADDVTADEFPRFFRIPRESYLASWAVLLHEFNPLISLEDLLRDADA